MVSKIQLIHVLTLSIVRKTNLSKNLNIYCKNKSNVIYSIKGLQKNIGHLGVAQLGSAPSWGGGGREFKSRHSDQHN